MSGGHTPGPWHVEGRQTEYDVTHWTVRTSYRVIAEMETWGDGGDEANARLIAAAPALADVVKAARELTISAVQLPPPCAPGLAHVDLDLLRALLAAVEVAHKALTPCTTPATHNEPAKEGDK
jgi:hypothetical protein